MPQRLKFLVAYDGRDFDGWQSQASGNGIQDVLERAFESVCGAKLRVHGAGRTDAGVHALAQCAHADVPQRKLAPETWSAALNASLPPAIRVGRCTYVSDRFHARFSARGKLYRYRLWNDRFLSPFEQGRAWHVVLPLDFALLEREAQRFVGQHDFASFAANRGTPEQETTRTIEAVTVRQRGCLLTVEVAGEGFLYKMVRLMVGALVRCATGRGPEEEIEERLRKAEIKGARPAAPAQGLYLVRVRY